MTPDPVHRRQVPLAGLPRVDDAELCRRAADIATGLTQRRSVRHFSDRPVPQAAIDDCLRVALSAPSGANQQPWHFVTVRDPGIKARIREAAEEEERTFYQGRAPAAWLDALGRLGTDEHKPFLEDAPCLIVIFAQTFGERDGDKIKHYYVQESVGIATGMLVGALHQVGLASLTHTPSPMRFLNEILDRPSSERPFLILVVGHPADGATVPDIERRPFDRSVTRR